MMKLLNLLEIFITNANIRKLFNQLNDDNVK